MQRGWLYFMVVFSFLTVELHEVAPNQEEHQVLNGVNDIFRFSPEIRKSLSLKFFFGLEPFHCWLGEAGEEVEQLRGWRNAKTADQPI